MKVVIINGYPGSGKDTFVGMCEKIWDWRFVSNYHTSDAAKGALLQLGWNGEKTNEARQLLSALVQFAHDNGVIEREIQNLIDVASSDSIIFVHCREYRHIIRLRQRFNAITLFIQRDSVAATYDNPSDANAGEHQEIYDYTIFNNGTLVQLSHGALSFLRAISGGAI